MTVIDRTAITEWLDSHELVHGIGTAEAACSISAINLALTGSLTDADPSECMSPVIQSWVVGVQDSMPVGMMARDDEHGRRWRQALPLVAGSRDPGREQDRLDLILVWMWGRLGDGWEAWVPPEAHDAWRTMLSERTEQASGAAAVAARATASAASAAGADYPAARAAARAASAAAADCAAARAAAAAGADYAAACSTATAAADWWGRADPAALLTLLVR